MIHLLVNKVPLVDHGLFRILCQEQLPSPKTMTVRKITPGGLVQMWYRLQEILYTWYEQIQQEALRSAVLHGDESGWRVDGKTYWLWCFTTRTLTYYMIDRSRGSPALKKFFIEEFAGTLVTDFWAA
jgi:transposase